MNYGKLIYACAMLTALSIVACGIVYPLAVTVFGTVAFPGGREAARSTITVLRGLAADRAELQRAGVLPFQAVRRGL